LSSAKKIKLKKESRTRRFWAFEKKSKDGWVFDERTGSFLGGYLT